MKLNQTVKFRLGNAFHSQVVKGEVIEVHSWGVRVQLHGSSLTVPVQNDRLMA